MKRYLKFFAVAGLLVCTHNIYKATFGQYSGKYGSSHEYFDSVSWKKPIGNVETRPTDYRVGTGNASLSATSWTREIPKPWMKDFDPNLTGNLSQLMGPYVKELLNGSSGACFPAAANSNVTCKPIWQRHLAEITAKKTSGAPYFLTEVLQVRLYEEDKARWTLSELKQWFHYMFLAGVEHIFICDHYFKKTEMLRDQIRKYIDLGLVTYIPWGEVRHPMTAQIRCYQHIIDTYKHRCQWQLAVDMDEYPVSPVDTREGFLVRYLHNMTKRVGNALTEISMANYLMLGQGDRHRDILIERINRMTPKAANVLVKPVYRPQRVRANVHHNHLISGRPMTADTSELRMLHYWGSRVQGWGPDTQKTLAITIEMNEMRKQWAPQVRNSLLVLGEIQAFSNSTGP